MQTLTIELPRPHAAQTAIIRGAKRFNVLDCGRRFGKNIVCQNVLIRPALAGRPVGWFAPTYKMLSDDWRTAKHALAPVIQRVSEQEKQLELVTGGIVDFWSLDKPDAARGKRYARAVINEAAHVKGLLDAWSMVIRPTLVDFHGDVFFSSTPNGLNDFYTLWQRANGDSPDWVRWQYPTSANPFIDPDEIEVMRHELPERVFRQEILAEFVENGSYFQSVTESATVASCDDPKNHEGHTLVMGVDWALSNDYTVMVIGCRECNRVVDWQRFNQIDFTYQRERLYTLADRWHVSGVLPERNSIGEPNIEIIRERVPVVYGPDEKPGFQTTATTKPALIQGLANALEHDGFKVPIESADELRSYEVETMASGHPRFGAPEGMHDDWVIALALTWRAMTSARVQIYI